MVRHLHSIARDGCSEDFQEPPEGGPHVTFLTFQGGTYACSRLAGHDTIIPPVVGAYNYA